MYRAISIRDIRDNGVYWRRNTLKVVILKQITRVKYFGTFLGVSKTKLTSEYECTNNNPKYIIIYQRNIIGNHNCLICREMLI